MTLHSLTVKPQPHASLGARSHCGSSLSGNFTEAHVLCITWDDGVTPTTIHIQTKSRLSQDRKDIIS
jgi:hypothetical protein